MSFGISAERRALWRSGGHGRTAGPALSQPTLQAFSGSFGFVSGAPINTQRYAKPQAKTKGKQRSSAAHAFGPPERCRGGRAPEKGMLKLTKPEITRDCPLSQQDAEWLEEVIDSLGLSVHTGQRILKVATTIADLAGEPQITRQHLQEAVGYRSIDRLNDLPT